MITPLQCKLARTALDLGIRALSAAAGVGSTTILRFEKQDGGTSSATVETLQQFFEARGIQFVENGIIVPPDPCDRA